MNGEQPVSSTEYPLREQWGRHRIHRGGLQQAQREKIKEYLLISRWF